MTRLPEEWEEKRDEAHVKIYECDVPKPIGLLKTYMYLFCYLKISRFEIDAFVYLYYTFN